VDRASTSGDPPAERLRALPSVHRLAAMLDEEPHALAVSAARDALAAARERVRRGEPAGDVEADARARLARSREPGPAPVLNATGVLIHTNLGRVPLAERALEAAVRAGAGYSDLEYSLERGERGSRQDHVEGLLCEVTGAEAALVVNNGAAAVLLAAAALASGREIVVSRGQLIEIGGSFRIPDVVAESGAALVEVGTTNRTWVADYERALGPETGAILRAHPSNFRVVGFAEDVRIEELCGLGVPVIDDVGSGALATGLPQFAGEPAVPRSVRAGCAVVCFSGDKLLGGPQAGIMVGRRDALEACRLHPLARAVRIDKLSLAALTTTLGLYRDPALARAEIPVLRMLEAPRAALEARATLMRDLIGAGGGRATVVETTARVGGGALPLLELSGPACAVEPGRSGADELARRLRAGRPPVVGRLHEGRLLLDPRTLTDDEARRAAQAVVRALG
jgi:L-seryl-tRNA(Ser) seleniumtransferase